MGYKRLTEAQKQAIRDLDAQLYRQSQIARTVGVSTVSVWNVLNDHKSYRYVIEPPKPRPKVPYVLPAVTDPSLLRRITAGR